MHEEQFWNTLSDSAGVWKLLVVGCMISLVLYVVLRVAMGAVADRKTRRILLESMKDEDRNPPGAEADGEPEDPSHPSRAERTPPAPR